MRPFCYGNLPRSKPTTQMDAKSKSLGPWTHRLAANFRDKIEMILTSGQWNQCCPVFAVSKTQTIKMRNMSHLLDSCQNTTFWSQRELGPNFDAQSVQFSPDGSSKNFNSFPNCWLQKRTQYIFTNLHETENQRNGFSDRNQQVGLITTIPI